MSFKFSIKPYQVRFGLNGVAIGVSLGFLHVDQEVDDTPVKVFVPYGVTFARTPRGLFGQYALLFLIISIYLPIFKLEK